MEIFCAKGLSLGKGNDVSQTVTNYYCNRICGPLCAAEVQGSDAARGQINNLLLPKNQIVAEFPPAQTTITT